MQAIEWTLWMWRLTPSDSAGFTAGMVLTVINTTLLVRVVLMAADHSGVFK